MLNFFHRGFEKFVKREPDQKGRVYMAEMAEQWLRSVRFCIKETSYVKYHNIVKNHIIPDLGQVEVGELTTTVIENFIEEKLLAGNVRTAEGLSEKTVKDILGVAKGICRFAAGQGLEIPCHFDQIRIRMRNTEVLLLSEEEQRRLVNFLLRDEDPKKTGILLSLYMGLRLGEVCALKAENIKLETGILQVRHTMQRIQNLNAGQGRKTKVIITEPKSLSSNRDIPIPAFLLKRLEILQMLPRSAYILTGRPDQYIEPRTMENILDRYLKLCGINSVNYHALRHTFATRCVEIGFDAKTLSEILGHSNVNITLNRYVHSSMEHKRRSMAIFG